MTTLYVFEHYEVYNVYSTLEKAEKAKLMYIEKYQLKYAKDYSETELKDYSYFLKNELKIREVKEGEAFGNRLYIDQKETQDLIVD